MLVSRSGKRQRDRHIDICEGCMASFNRWLEERPDVSYIYAVKGASGE